MEAERSAKKEEKNKIREDEVQEAPPVPERNREENVLHEVFLGPPDEQHRSNEIAVDILPESPENPPFVPCKIEKEWKMWIPSICDIGWPFLLLSQTYVYQISPLGIAGEGRHLGDIPITAVAIAGLALLPTYAIQFLMGLFLLLKLLFGNIPWLPMVNCLRLYKRVCYFLIVMMAISTIPALVVYSSDAGMGEGLDEIIVMLHASLYMSLRLLSAFEMETGIQFLKAHENQQHRHCKLDLPN